jgi:hypothetical protein
MQRRAVKAKANGASLLPRVQSSAAFVASFEAPEYIIAGILQQRFTYSFTG